MEKVLMVRRITNERESELRFFPLERLLPTGQALSVNTTYLIASLVSTNAVNGNPILRQQLLTETDMRLLLLLLESPNYCPQEVLRASLYAAYSDLLDGLFSPKSAAKAQWQTTIAEQRLLLQRAQELGTWKKELKPLYNALSKLRPKLHPFGLEIALFASCSAYALMPFWESPGLPGESTRDAPQASLRVPRSRHQRRSNSHSPLLVTEASA